MIKVLSAIESFLPFAQRGDTKQFLFLRNPGEEDVFLHPHAFIKLNGAHPSRRMGFALKIQVPSQLKILNKLLGIVLMYN